MMRKVSQACKWASKIVTLHASMGKKRNAYRILVGKADGKRPLGKPRRRWEDSVMMDLREVGWGGMGWIQLSQDREQWRSFVNTVINLWVP
jgi:hypothetical protein